MSVALGRPEKEASMAKRTKKAAADFTVSELKAMLAAKTRIEELTPQRDALRK